MTTPIHHRHATFPKAAIDEEKRTIALSFSSPEPIDQGEGYVEILDHSPGAADLTRLQGGALLLDHDPQKVLGRVESATIGADGRGRAICRFGKGPLASEIWSDVLDGIRDQISFAYRVRETKPGTDKHGNPALIVTRWAAHEVSVVGIAADHTVGIGRSLSTQPTQPIQPMKIEPAEKPKNNDAAIREARQAFTECNMPPPDEITARALAGELTVDEYRLATVEHYKKRHANPTPSGESRREMANDNTRSLGARLFGDTGFRDFASRSGKKYFSRKFDDIVNVRAALTISGTGITSVDPTQRIQEINNERLTVADLFAQGTTTAKTVTYFKEQSYTNTAATVAEGASKPELDIDLEDEDATVTKIAAWVRVSDEMLDDIPAAEAWINMRLRYAVEEREELQLLAGGGTGTDLTGILNTSGVNTQALGGDNRIDAIRKGITKIQVNARLQPTGIVVHPNDWEAIELLKDTAGQYLVGSVFVRGEMNQIVRAPSIWGLPVVVTSSMTENTVLVGAFRPGGMIFRRKGVEISASNSDGDNFTKNLVTVLCEERLALTVNIPAAFTLVTGV